MRIKTTTPPIAPPITAPDVFDAAPAGEGEGEGEGEGGGRGEGEGEGEGAEPV